ncbi:MAG TPA: HGxxPAAW family protein [Dermatophilaceae bacterium]|nr:HGxxPAAW family protein [Dermatophilaceae bacterium]
MEQHEDHGHSVAAWTAVGIILVGVVITSIAIVMANVPLAIVGAVVIVAGAIAGKVLAMAGYGARSHDTEREPLLADAPDELGTETRGKS